LIEYALLQDSVAIFYFSPVRSGVKRVAVLPVALRALVERCDDLLQHRASLAAVLKEDAALYRLLIGPIAAELAGAEQVIIVPDRRLHTIPFAALYDTARGRYLVDDFAMSVAPSAAFVLRGRASHALAPVLVVEDPQDDDTPSLPGAAREAETIAAMYQSSTLLDADNATRARFITAARKSGLIHYAGHAESDLENPLGALHLAAGTNHESGDLDANAIARLRLTNSPLVILAACGTIRGESEHVEGMPSIARAFLAAGARNVVGTLWEVDDDTVAPLFRRLHRELRAGATPSDALRTAQLALVHDSDARLSHPATWAPIELLGYSNETKASENHRSR
jgi:CHAT domain-containing protein